MARLKRSKEPRGIWHAMSRGVRQSPIFLTDKQKKTFLDIMQWAQEASSVELIDFCLMDNHYHCLAEGTGAQLGRFVQRLNSRYARDFNECTESNGHLFQGRFRAYKAKSEAWVASRSLYFHTNPVEAGLVADPMKYRWSGLGALLGNTNGPPVIHPEKVLRVFGGDPATQQARYSESLHRAIQQCLANRAIVDGIASSNGTNQSLEEVRLSVSDARRLLLATELSLRGASHGCPIAGSVQALTAHLGRKWKIASSHVLAAVLGCSRRNVLKQALKGSQLLAAMPDAEALTRQIHKSYLRPL